MTVMRITVCVLAAMASGCAPPDPVVVAYSAESPVVSYQVRNAATLEVETHTVERTYPQPVIVTEQVDTELADLDFVACEDVERCSYLVGLD